MTMVCVPTVSEDASTVSSVLVEAHALIAGDVVPVTDTVPPTVSSGLNVALARGFVETKTVADDAVKTNPSIDPSPW
jgi:hypothetical protein